MSRVDFAEAALVRTTALEQVPRVQKVLNRLIEEFTLLATCLRALCKDVRPSEPFATFPKLQAAQRARTLRRPLWSEGRARAGTWQQHGKRPLSAGPVSSGPGCPSCPSRCPGGVPLAVPVGELQVASRSIVRLAGLLF
ncbi:hypothetical protein KFL_002270020 [Klebsormidium nitens]|uniref:Uncharacterized protein n=1 Tax=Klebsormidium nitens TaxID=105231 RepID=A0A1Y1I2W4_KLENI|nr:hypothetical protein KFL_002270020 [Klebsormidium nitens]|eukprot:GAQ85270.1 hypothetical protein KFL_002270020 [Klebsormidium nitens]